MRMESGIASALATINQRLNGIESDIAEMKASYLTKEGGVNIKDNLERNCKDIEEVKGNQSKILWFVFFAVLSAVLSWIFKG